MSSRNNRLKKPLWCNDTQQTYAKRVKYLNCQTLFDVIPADKLASNIIELHVQSDEVDLQDYIRRYGRAIEEKNAPLLGYVPGYDDDPRELHEIPEVVELFKRVISSGMLCFFEGNMPVEDDYNPMVLGAFQIWTGAKGLWAKQSNGLWSVEFTPELAAAFRHDWTSTNAVADKVLAQWEAK